jgi:superfamily II DNA or RNA helicase
MKTLFPKQQEAHDFFVEQQEAGNNTCDTSHTGIGKTVVACQMALTLGRPVVVICPKSVVPSWGREMEETGLSPLFILNYEKLRTGKTPHMSKRGKKFMRWVLPKGTLVLVDEVHKCKGPYTQNAQLLISLIQQGYSVHGMSATASEDPTEMRGLGFMLGMHSLNKTENGLHSWYSWMLRNGCDQNEWGKWELTDSDYLPFLKEEMYSKNVKMLTVKDFPDSFKKNRVIIEPLAFSNGKKIKAAYEEAEITPEIIRHYIEWGTVEDSEHILTNILRARMLAESLKVPDLVEMAEDLVLEGKSVVLFVNFTDTIQTLCQNLNCDRIQGGQSSEERQEAIDKFQRDEKHVLVANIAAGGTGISLHDTLGERQRVSIICPSFSAKDYLQTLGRIHRNGAKSDALQKVVISHDSIEEVVMDSISIKINNLQTLHEPARP